MRDGLAMSARADFHRALVVHAGPMRTGFLAVLASLAELRQRATALIGPPASLHLGGLRRGTGNGAQYDDGRKQS